VNVTEVGDLCVVQVIKDVETVGTWMQGNYEKRTESFGPMTPDVTTY